MNIISQNEILINMKDNLSDFKIKITWENNMIKVERGRNWLSFLYSNKKNNFNGEISMMKRITKTFMRDYFNNCQYVCTHSRTPEYKSQQRNEYKRSMIIFIFSHVMVWDNRSLPMCCWDISTFHSLTVPHRGNRFSWRKQWIEKTVFNT